MMNERPKRRRIRQGPRSRWFSLLFIIQHSSFIIFRVPVLLLLLTPPSLALARDKPEVLGESGRTARRLQEIAEKETMARAKPTEERWTEVVDELQALLTSAGSDLVPAEDGRCVPARWVCHARLAGLPSEVLAR